MRNGQLTHDYNFMQIETIKETTGGFILNESVFVPNDALNKDFKKIQEWVSDGGVVKPEFTLEEIKSKKIQELQAITSAEIYNQYPLHKQINIAGRVDGYNDEDFDEMNEFITSKIDYHRSIESEINNCESIEEVEAINLGE